MPSRSSLASRPSRPSHASVLPSLYPTRHVLLPVSPLPDRFEILLEGYVAKEHNDITAIAIVLALEVLILDFVWREDGVMSGDEKYLGFPAFGREEIATGIFGQKPRLSIDEEFRNRA